METQNNTRNSKRKIPCKICVLILLIALIVVGLVLYLNPVMISYLLDIDLAIFNWINTGMSNMVFDVIMPWLTYLGDFWAGWIFIVILFMMNLKPVKRGIRICLFASLIYGCVSGLQSVVRYLVNRPRPFIDHEVIVRVAHLPTDPSFPSGHAATAFMIATILSDQFPKYRYVFYVFACLVSFSRVYLGLHYLSDVIVGALIGYGITRLLLTNKFLRTRITGIA